MFPSPASREPSVVVPKSTPNVPSQSVHAVLYSDRARNTPSGAFAAKKAVASAKVSRRCTIRQAPQAKPDAYRLSAIVANDDAVPENFFAAVPLRRVKDDISRLSGTHPKCDFEVNLSQREVNLT